MTTSTTVTQAHAAALSRLGQMLSDGTRTRILLVLREGPVRPSELAERLGVSKQVVSNQLACLRGCGLVQRDQQGRSTWYRLTDPRIGSALGDLLELTVTVDPDCCTPVSMVTGGTVNRYGPESDGCDGTCSCCAH